MFRTILTISSDYFDNSRSSQRFCLKFSSPGMFCQVNWRNRR